MRCPEVAGGSLQAGSTWVQALWGHGGGLQASHHPIPFSPMPCCRLHPLGITASSGCLPAGSCSHRHHQPESTMG